MTKNYYSSQLRQNIKEAYWQRKGLLTCEREKEFAKCVPLSPCPKKILLECGPVGAQRSFFAGEPTIPAFVNFDVASVTVDTSCFVKPIIDLQFSSQINVILDTENAPNDEALANLQFDLICRRNGGGELVVGTWLFRRVLIDSSSVLETTDTFSFDRCLSVTNCTGCTEYFVRVTPLNFSEAEDSAIVTVFNSQLIAKIQDS